MLAGAPAAEEETPPPAPPAPTEEMSETTEPLASIASLTGVDTQVALDADFLAALESLGVAPGVVGTATLTETTVAFPITGGNLDYYDPDSNITPFIQGDIAHDGSGLSLTAGDTVVELTDFLINTDTLALTGTVTVNGEVAAEGAELFTLDPAMLERLAVDEDAGTATLAGAELLLLCCRVP